MFLRFPAVLLVNILFLNGTFIIFAEEVTGAGQCCHKCPPFWTHFQNSCYRFFGTVKNWVEAEGYCNLFYGDTHEGHLVSIHNLAESNFVYALWHYSLINSSQLQCTVNTTESDIIASPLQSILIGAHDIGHEKKFTWTDGTPFDYNEWGPGEPSNSHNVGSEDCTHFVDADAPHAWKPWNDLPCDYVIRYPFICKIRLD
ncbi:echinoidin-like [Amphiura filiformis]|uniref:echinoidin-like n=1 Tax=Amphiura filiformis TaxID=82378 RepID=UPI003B21861C